MANNFFFYTALGVAYLIHTLIQFLNVVFGNGTLFQAFILCNLVAIVYLFLIISTELSKEFTESGQCDGGSE